jgi:hypothetical protein
MLSLSVSSKADCGTCFFPLCAITCFTSQHHIFARIISISRTVYAVGLS